MFSRFFSTLRGQSSKANSQSNRTKRRKNQRTLRCEALERRELYAVLTGESLVNSTTALNQYEAATASAPDGRSVVVWTHQYSSSDTDIYAQRFDSSGNKVGSEIRVAASTRNESQPDVSMDNWGDFVVTWRVQTTSTNADILAQRFNSAGGTRGTTITVASSTRNEYDPSIASDAYGNFVVAWTRDYSSIDQDVMARMYRDDGSAIAGEFSVAASASGDETNSDVARAPDGRFAISYQIDSGSGDVMLRRFSATGSSLSTLSIATGSTIQTNPRISMDTNANTVVVWQELVGSDFDIKARGVTNSGILDSTMTVRNSLDQEVMPDVAMKRDGTSFVVTHVNSTRQTIHATEMSTSGAIRRSDQIASSARLEAVAVAFSDGTDYSLAYSRLAGTQGANIYRRRGRLS